MYGTLRGYRTVLADRGFTLINFHEDSGKNGYGTRTVAGLPLSAIRKTSSFTGL